MYASRLSPEGSYTPQIVNGNMLDEPAVIFSAQNI